MTVESIMSRHVIKVSMDDSLRDVRHQLAFNHIHHVVVVEHHRVVGIISDRDVLANLSPFIGKPSERTADAAVLGKRVHQIMTRKLIAAGAETSVQDAALMLLHNNISCLPVVDGAGACVGIVTWRDILRCTFDAAAGLSANKRAA